MKKNLEQQLEMIARGNHDEIMAYIDSCHHFSAEAETTLINRGNHDIIMSYMDRYRFYGDAEVALVVRGNHEEIMTYLEANGRYICLAAKQMLIERDNIDELKLINV